MTPYAAINDPVGMLIAPVGRMMFDGWDGPLRTALVGVLAYAMLVLLLRISGKRTLSKLNAFDLVVTVALGSTLATVLLSQDVALAEGVTAFAVLIALQWAITWGSVRSSRVARLVKAEPSLLFYKGSFLGAVMKRERMTQTEVRAAVRAQGLADLQAVDAIVLETDGSVTVIAGARHAGLTVLDGVHGAPARGAG